MLDLDHNDSAKDGEFEFQQKMMIVSLIYIIAHVLRVLKRITNEANTVLASVISEF